jgi:hypothetical protein
MFSLREAKRKRRGAGVAAFSEDFSVMSDFLGTKPYVDTARTEKSFITEKDPERLCV